MADEGCLRWRLRSYIRYHNIARDFEVIFASYYVNEVMWMCTHVGYYQGSHILEGMIFTNLC
jgi:hypothetical protein